MKVQCNTKIDKDVKDKAKPILKTLGLSLSVYMNLCLHQLVLQEGIPFDVTAKEAKPIEKDVDKVDSEIETVSSEQPSAEAKSGKQRKSKTAKALSQFDF